MSNTITDLHAHLFATLQGLRDGSITVERAAMISQVAQTLVNVAKVEVDFLRVTEQSIGSGFLPEAPAGDGEAGALPNGITGIVRHRIKG